MQFHYLGFFVAFCHYYLPFLTFLNLLNPYYCIAIIKLNAYNR